MASEIIIAEGELRFSGACRSEIELDEFVGRLVQAARILWPEDEGAEETAAAPPAEPVRQRKEPPPAPAAKAPPAEPPSIDPDNSVPLTHKEASVLRLTKEGKSVKACAEQLGLAESTITNLRVALRKRGLL